MTINSGRVQVRRMKLVASQSGYFRVEVTPFQRQTYRYIFSGRVIGSGNNVIGQPAVDDVTFSFPVNAKNDQVTIELVSDSHMPCAFLSAEWEAMFQLRSKRV